jgi:hypothetical protein
MFRVQGFRIQITSGFGASGLGFRGVEMKVAWAKLLLLLLY